jgi:hypothetical protein
MAVALSARAPIFVARPIVERDALTHDDLAQAPSSSPAGEPGSARTYDL